MKQLFDDAGKTCLIKNSSENRSAKKAFFFSRILDFKKFEDVHLKNCGEFCNIQITAFCLDSSGSSSSHLSVCFHFICEFRSRCPDYRVAKLNHNQ